MKIEGKVIEVTADGDLISDITAEQLGQCSRDAQTRVVIDDEHETFGIYDSPDGQPSMTLLAVQSGDEVLRLHLVGDSAAAMLCIRPGASIRVLT